MRIKPKFLILFFSLLAIIFIVLNLRLRNRNSELKANGIIVNGIIKSFSYRAKSQTLDVKFDFFIENKIYSSEASVNGIFRRDFEDNFIGKNFPVIVLKHNLRRNKILITPDSFERFGIIFPDSLDWVRKYWTKDYIIID